jgi:parvulin-like peptidyl-prolyl isomerase
MKTKIDLLFSGALAVTLMISLRVNGATATAGSSTNANPNAAMTALFGDPVVAKGKGFEIKRSDLDEVMMGIKSALATRGETASPEQITAVEGNMLNRLIQIQLLLQKATDADKAEGKKKADAQVAALLERAGSEETLDRQLKAAGWTPTEFRTKINQEATATAALTRELATAVSPAEIKQYYDDHSADFEQPEMAHVRHILLMTVDPVTHAPLPDDQQKAKRKQIDDLLKRVRAGENFAALAKQYSEDPSSKDKGGELLPFPRGQMVPEFEATAFSMKTNTVSEVVTSAYGYHIIQLLDKVPAKKFALADKIPSSDVLISDRVKDMLMEKKVGKSAPAYLGKLKQAANVEIMDGGLKTAVAAADAAALTNAPALTP